LLPAATDDGEAEFVTIRSACVESATTSAAVAVLFAVFGSAVAELTVAISLIAVPAVALPLTFSFTVKLADPAAKLGLVQLMVPALPAAGVLHDHPVGRVPMDWKVVFAGVVSLKLAVVAVLGPALLTTCV
jgi:hypothetical protein